MRPHLDHRSGAGVIEHRRWRGDVIPAGGACLGNFRVVLGDGDRPLASDRLAVRVYAERDLAVPLSFLPRQDLDP
jgi:hypothetical protein